MNIKKLPLLLLASAGLLLSSCDEQGYCLEGEGDMETRMLDLPRFSGVSVSGGSKVFIRKGSSQKVEVRGQGNILDVLETEVQDGVWDIEYDRCLRSHETVEVYITVPELREANVSGSGKVELEDIFRGREFRSNVSGSGSVLLRLATEKLSTRISGSGTIRAAGMADEQEISVSGSGSYKAYDLDSRRAEVSISGSGKAEVDVERELNADISGSGKVYYTGTPSVNTSVSGSGKVVKK